MDYVYLCDGKACSEMCANKTKEEWDEYECHHTSDERHAKNKCRRARKFEKVATDSGVPRLKEIDPRDK